MLRHSLTLLLALALALPLASMLYSWTLPTSDAVASFLQHRGTDHLVTTLALLIGSTLLSAFIAVPLAWLVSRYEFPLVRHYRWMLCLPLTLPAYVTSYSYIGLLEHGALLNLPSLNIRHAIGAILIFGLGLYPYIYVAARFVFSSSMRQSIASAQMLGLHGWQLFWRVGVPLSRPAWIAGGALVAMEVLADYGAVSLLAQDTLTTGLFRLWFFYQDHAAAVQLAASMLIIVALLLYIERRSRLHKRYSQPYDVQHWGAERQPLNRAHAMFASTACILPLLLGFVVPLIMLLHWALQDHAAWLAQPLWESVMNSLFLMVLSAIVIVFAAWLVTTNARLRLTRAARTMVGLASVGYAVPGSVIAVALLVPLIALDRPLAHTIANVTGAQASLWLTGTAIALIYAYLVRFTSVAVQQLQSSYHTIPKELDDSATMLGTAPKHIPARIHQPLLTHALVASTLLVMVEVVKELPATLIIRPFNLETLATRSYGLAADQFFVGASHYACMMVALSAVPLWFWQWWSDRHAR